MRRIFIALLCAFLIGGTCLAEDRGNGDDVLIFDDASNDLVFSDFDANNIFMIEPNYTLTLGDNIARLDWGSGELEFSGSMTEGAIVFFEFLKPYVDEYIRYKLKNVTEEGKK